jgi:predicted nucleotidyltransferase component of viral defense system
LDEAYANTVRLLLSIALDVFAGNRFAMKGGTAINMFVRDMPRVSVDIDVVYTPREGTREEALPAIADELAGIAKRFTLRGLQVRGGVGSDPAESRLIVENGHSEGSDGAGSS